MYIEGEREREWKIYFLNGNLKSIGQFVNNLKNSEWKEYESTDQFKMINYVKGKIV